MTTYARRLGLFSVTMAVIGGIIGGGIFRTPAEVARQVGTPGLILAAWIVGGVVALIGAYCFGALGRAYPRAGGGYVYLREAWGPLPAFLYGWALLLVIATGAIAAVAVTFANYALELASISQGYAAPVAVGAIVLVSGINYVGIRPGAVAQNAFTILKLLALAALIVVGLALAIPPSLRGQAIVGEGTGASVVSFGAALVAVLFTYGGFQQTNFIAEEIVDVERTLPRALLLGVGGVVAVYLFANVAYLRVLDPGGLAVSEAPAAELMYVMLGDPGRTIIAGGIAASTFGFLSLCIMVTPRVFQAMAADGVFFPRLAALHPVYRTPTAAILLQAGWAIVLTLSGTFGQLVNYVSFGDWIFFGLTVAGLYRLAPAIRAGVPGYPVTPALFILASAYVVVSSVLAAPKDQAIGAGLLLLGIPLYWFWTRRRRSLPSASQSPGEP